MITINLKNIEIIPMGETQSEGGSAVADGKGLTDIFAYDGKLIGMEEDGNWRNEVYFKTINVQSIIGEEGDIVIAGGEGGSSVAGVSAINIGQNEDERYQRTGVVKLFTQWYNGSYDVSIGSGNISTSFYGLKPIDGTIQIESAGGTANGNQRCGIKISDDVMNRIATLEAQIQQLLNA